MLRVPVDLKWLDRQLGARGWLGRRRLAKMIGVTPGTITMLYRTGSTSPATFEKLYVALTEAPPDEMVVRLMGETEGAA